MNRFLYLIFTLFSCIAFDCVGKEHMAYASFEFYNSLNEMVTLKPKLLEAAYIPKDFKPFEEQQISSKGRIFFEENLANYEEVKTPEDSQIMLQIDVIKGESKIGVICLIREISPDPSFIYKTEDNNLGLELRIQRSRCGPQRTIEIAQKNNN